MEKLFEQVKQWSGGVRRKDSVSELSRSQYSLVSCGELTPAAVNLWLGLPKEVKYDPALAPFRRLYEKEHGSTEQPPAKRTPKKRLPYVASAPQMNNNLHTVEEEESLKTPTTNNANNNNNNGGLEIPLWKKEHGVDSAVGSDKTLSMLSKAGHYIKITLLLAVWVFFTVVFMMYNERDVVTRQSTIAGGEVKEYLIPRTEPNFRVQFKLTGPFLSDQQEQSLNSSLKETLTKMTMWLERWTLTNPYSSEGMPRDVLDVETSEKWSAILDSADNIDFSVGVDRSTLLSLTSSYNTTNAVYVVKMETNVNENVPFSMSYVEQPIDRFTGVMYSTVLLCGLYVLICFEIINRTMAAIIVSTTAIAVLSIIGERPSLPELISWLDVETLLLLFSMMLLVAIMAETGMFDFLAVFTFEVTKGRMWPLINLLCAITALLSTFLDNVTTVLLMTPVTIRLCEVMELDPVPILMCMVLYSNIGGTATPVGDPPNVIIASNKDVVDAGINFANFTMHMTVAIILVCVQTYFQLKFIYRDTNNLRLKVPKEIQELRHQIAIWRRAADSLAHFSQDELIVKERLERKVKKLNVQLEAKIKETTKRACPKDTFQSTLQEMKLKYPIRDVGLLVKCSVALFFVVVVFFLHALPDMQRVSLAWTALLGAVLVLVLADREELEPVLHRVEWSTLMFFAALFVLMEALAKLGLIDFIGEMTESVILLVGEESRLVVALMLMLWVSGISSAFVDNIPLTTMMVRVVTSLGANPTLGLPTAPLVWALSLGACLGGNGTLIGASANVVCAGVAEQHGYKISFGQFFKVGFPLMIGHLIVASGYLLLCHCVFTWH